MIEQSRGRYRRREPSGLFSLAQCNNQFLRFDSWTAIFIVCGAGLVMDFGNSAACRLELASYLALP
jgi:hypothetical protein